MGHFRIIFIFTTVFVFTVIVHRSSSIKCWRCQSHSDPKCADPFDNSSYYITDCDFETLAHMPNVKATLCRKIRQKVEGEWRFIRSCAFVGEAGEGTGNENHCLMRTGTYDIFMEYCTCKSKDGCNGATSARMTFGTLFGITALGLFAISSWWYHWHA